MTKQKQKPPTLYLDWLARSFLQNGFLRLTLQPPAIILLGERTNPNGQFTPTNFLSFLRRPTDVDDVKFVINYDFPGNIEDYVHRIGRTGRSNNKGTSYTFFTQANGAKVDELINILQETNQVGIQRCFHPLPLLTFLLLTRSTSTQNSTRSRSSAAATVEVVDATTTNTEHSRRARSDRKATAAAAVVAVTVDATTAVDLRATAMAEPAEVRAAADSATESLKAVKVDLATDTLTATATRALTKLTNRIVRLHRHGWINILESFF